MIVSLANLKFITNNMKLRTVLTAFALCVACSMLAEKYSPAQQLLQRMQKLQKKGYMYGHQDDPFYGISWEWDKDKSDTKELVGDYPAVMGFDLGGIEMGDFKNLDSVPFKRMREEIINHHKRGGIITISWHPRNPMIGTTAWIQSDTIAYNQAVEALDKIGQGDVASLVINPKNTVRSVLPGGSHHDVYMTWLKRVADFMLTLKDDNGNAVPFIFRPYHENNGSWFWWGQNLCSDEEYHLLWIMTQDFISNYRGSLELQGAKSPDLKNTILWSYSPNLQGNWTEEAWMKRYPGDDRVDIIGEDAYQWGAEADFKRQLDADLALITSIAQKHNKLIAMTECGYQNSPDATWWQRVFKPIIEKYPICYLLPWRNYKKEHFGASKDANTADDFKAWSEQKNFLFLNDIKKIK